MPQLAREIVRQLIEQEAAGCDVTEVGSPEQLAERVLESRPQLVVVGEEGAFSQAVDELLAAITDIRVLAVRENGRAGYLCELRPERRELGEIGPETLREVLRGAA